MEQEDILSEEDLNTIMDEKGFIHHNISIRGNKIKTLGKLKKVYGTLGIDSESLNNLGELDYIKSDLWISKTTKNLKSLCKLEIVGGDLTLRYSNINSLGNLFKVLGRLSLRDTSVQNINSLKYVGELFLPKRLENNKYDFIETKKKIRFWNDKITKTQNNKVLEDVGGENLRYNLIVNFENNNYSIDLTEWKVPTNPNDRYFKSKEEIKNQNEKFQFYKNCILSNNEFLNDFGDGFEIQKLFDRLKFEQLTLLKSKKISEELFIDNILYFEKVFSKFEVRNYEFIDFFKLKEKYEIMFELVSNSHYLPPFSDIHELELKLKKRILSGEVLTNKCVKISYLNGFIIKNIKEFYEFIDKKLDEIYNGNYSFYDSLFGNTKSVEEINNEFPKKLRVNPNENHSFKYLEKRVILSKEYITENKNNPPFKKYYNVREKFDDGFDVKKIWNSSSLWLSYNQNPLSYIGYSTNSFIYFVENKIYETFSLLILNSQDEFRVFKGVPKIGEGWVSETELYNLLKYEFEKEEVIHHGKPKWLGLQHVDIWIPKYKIGIEYQGEQHHKPIDFFGGEESFIKNQERDERKKRLFKENNSVLIEVLPNYKIEGVILEIENIINSLKK